MNYQFLPLALEHIDAVCVIENQAHSHPWSSSLLRDINGRGACHHVLLCDGALVGYFYAQNIVGEVTLLNIAVAPNEQGKGHGKYLMQAFLDMCSNANADSAWLEVRESNVGAYGLYEAFGFNEVDRRVNYYPTAKGKEDAIIMSYLFF